jgi:hypothetical protein
LFYAKPCPEDSGKQQACYTAFIMEHHALKCKKRLE